MIWKSLTWRIRDICWYGLFRHLRHIRFHHFVIQFISRDSMYKAMLHRKLGEHLDECLPKIASDLKVEMDSWAPTDRDGDYWSGGIVTVYKKKEN